MLVALALLVLVYSGLAYYLAREISHLSHLYSMLYKRVQAIDLSAQRLEKVYEVDARFQQKLKRLESPTVDLQEFLADLAECGCGIVRIDPGAIFIRGIRK